MMYTLAAWTGFRKGEIGSLTLRSLELDADPPTATVAACYSKRRREDTQVLHPELAAQLKAWIAGKPDLKSDEPLFPISGRVPGGTDRKTHKMMRIDLEAARQKWINEATSPRNAREREQSDFLAYKDHDGLFADFHSCRHLFITSLERAGISPKMAQTLARHSDIRLTLQTYTHVELHDQTAAIRSLPGPYRASQQRRRKETAAAGCCGLGQITAVQPREISHSTRRVAHARCCACIRLGNRCHSAGQQRLGTEVAASSVRQVRSSSRLRMVRHWPRTPPFPGRPELPRRRLLGYYSPAETALNRTAKDTLRRNASLSCDTSHASGCEQGRLAGASGRRPDELIPARTQRDVESAAANCPIPTCSTSSKWPMVIVSPLYGAVSQVPSRLKSLPQDGQAISDNFPSLGSSTGV